MNLVFLFKALITGTNDVDQVASFSRFAAEYSYMRIEKLKNFMEMAKSMLFQNDFARWFSWLVIKEMRPKVQVHLVMQDGMNFR